MYHIHQNFLANPLSKKMTTIYLHIGLPKTGTTSLQKFLFDNRDVLLEKGYLYPKSGINTESRHFEDRCAHSIIHKILKHPHEKEKLSQEYGGWDEIKQEITQIKPQNVIISSENLTGQGIIFPPTEILTWIKNQLANYKVKPIIYLRRQDKFFESYYSQLIKRGYIKRTFREYYNKVKQQYNYETLLEHWANVFGVENIIVRCLEKAQLVNQNNISDFLVAIAFPESLSELTFNDTYFKANVSSSPKVVKFLRWLNSINRGKRREFFKRIPGFSFEEFFLSLYENPTVSKVVNAIPDNWLSNELLTLEDRQQIMAECKEINEKIARKYLGRSNGQLFLETLS